MRRPVSNFHSVKQLQRTTSNFFMIENFDEKKAHIDVDESSSFTLDVVLTLALTFD